LQTLDLLTAVEAKTPQTHRRKISCARLLNSSAAGSVEASYLAAVVHPIHNFNMTSADGLLQETQTLQKLYDAECMMSINETIAQGYLVLLGGADSGKANGDQPKDISLAFMALAHGNVLDACFGVHTVGRREETPATRAAREAKQTIEECGGASDSFRVGAVEAYTEAFVAVIEYRKKYDRLNCITRCFRANKLRVSCETKLRESFLNLAKALAEQQH
jgi:hypothetical protein